MTKKIDAQTFTRTLTGFDELAITKSFGSPLEELNGPRIPRALMFIQLRRDGDKDTEAYKNVMGMTLGELEDIFESTDAEGNGDGSTLTPTTN